MTDIQEDEKKQVADTTIELSEKELSEKADFLGVPYLAEAPKINTEVVSVISEEVAKKYHIAGFEKNGKVTKIAMVNPQDFEALNVLRFIAQNKRMEFEIYLCSQKVLAEILKQYSGGTDGAIADAMKALQADGTNEDISELESVSKPSEDETEEQEVLQAAPVTKLLSVIIHHAVEGKASDIHIEPFDKGYRVRFRVDGILHASLTVPREVGRAVVSRIKILSNLKIDEKRKPQDGRFKITEDGHSIDFRVSSLPVVNGEKVVMRILDTGSKMADMKSMGLIGKGSEVMLKNIMEPFGIILITGPTGSGKSTTLYSCLEILNQEEKNIITLEDPVEYSIGGINQSQINTDIGYSFASGLRSILRQDPNVIMVGEIRDGETAELTIHAALTGHLVLSTLHTNSSIGAIPRLIDMGIEPFLLASSLRVVAAQRLVRRICEKCKKEVEITPRVRKYVMNEIEKVSQKELKKYEVDLSKEIHFYEGKGCSECGKTGYKGRVAIFEALEIDGEIKEVITEKRGSEVEVQKCAEKQGMISIKQDGMLKVIKGLTTFSEVERVTEGSLSVGGEMDDDKG